ncbi:uncharacterized protein VTP21DRAFT_1377 [Calcarisporiella thermophila]|uniref:uncharacterized protein n=1 Tax=Calcarisporiella thermophila TaxID=911321 RepID=UPI0037446719
MFGSITRGSFTQNIHWTLETFANDLSKRRRHLAFLMMPPDASWPLISQISRRHEYSDLTTRISFRMFDSDLIEFVQEGNSTDFNSHFRDMLFQRAPMDEYRTLIKSTGGNSPDTNLVRKAIVEKIKDVVRYIQSISKFDEIRSDLIHREQEVASGEDLEMVIPENTDFWELIIETADQLYSFVANE